MKVIICPKCRISPEITTTEIKCPKCGRKSVGVDLADTVTKWNKEEYAEAGKPVQVVIKDVEAIKEEVKEEVKAEIEAEEKAEKKPAKKTEKKPAKKGAK